MDDPTFVSSVYYREPRAALTWLEQGYDERARWMCSLRVFPPFDPLRNEPRFKALVARMQFP